MKKTLLFGNGFNMLSTDNLKYSWDSLLIDLGHQKKHKECQIKICECKSNNKEAKTCNCYHTIEDSLPYTMIYENLLMQKALLEREINEKNFKDKIAEIMKNINSNEFYEIMKASNFDHYITTNYDHAFEKTINEYEQPIDNSEKPFDNSEQLYSIRRYNKYQIGKRAIKLWHMHGDINNPKSIQLGLDHYAGAIGKIDAYIKGNYEYINHGEPIKVPKIKAKLNPEKDNSIENYEISWIDLFFNSHIHIIGFGLDYSEYDLWWILNKRARFMAEDPKLIHNTITYYFTKDIEESKKELLKSFNVITKHISALDKDGKINYKEFTKKALKEASK